MLDIICSIFIEFNLLDEFSWILNAIVSSSSTEKNATSPNCAVR